MATKHESLDEALFVAKSQMPTILRTAKGVHNKYAKLEDVKALTDPVFVENRILLDEQPAEYWTDDGKQMMGITIRVVHLDSKEEREYTRCMPNGNLKPQDVGSLDTYMRRYLYMLVSGTAPEDDDGQSANNSYDSRNQQGKGRKASTNGHSAAVKEAEKIIQSLDDVEEMNPNGPGETKNFLERFVSYQQDLVQNSSTRMSQKQHGYLVGLLDKYGQGKEHYSHAILWYLSGEEVSKDNPTPRGLKELLDNLSSWSKDEGDEAKIKKYLSPLNDLYDMAYESYTVMLEGKEQEEEIEKEMAAL